MAQRLEAATSATVEQRRGRQIHPKQIIGEISEQDQLPPLTLGSYTSCAVIIISYALQPTMAVQAEIKGWQASAGGLPAGKVTMKEKTPEEVLAQLGIGLAVGIAIASFVFLLAAKHIFH